MGERLKQTPKVAASQQPLTIEQRFVALKQNLKVYVTHQVTKAEKALFETVIKKFKQKTSFTPQEAQTELKKLGGPPFYLYSRTAALQKAVLSWIIQKLDTGAPKALKEKLITTFIALNDTRNNQEQQLIKILRKHNLGDLVFSNSGKRRAADPLNDLPSSVKLDDNFYKGRKADDILPLGIKNPDLPSDIMKMLKSGDPMQILFFKILVKNIYNPIMKWYEGLSKTKRYLVALSSKIVLGKQLVDYLKAWIRSAIETYNAKWFLKNVNQMRKNVPGYVKGINNLLSTLRKLTGKKSIPSSLNQVLKDAKLATKGATQKEVNNTIGVLLNASAGVLDIAKRNPRAMRAKRIANRPNCFLQNKLFYLTLLQHKGAKGMKKDMIEFFAMVIANFNGDKELRARLNDLRPTLDYLLLQTPMGLHLAKSLGFEGKWKKVKNKKLLIDKMLGLLWPQKALSANEKKKPVNGALNVVRRMFNGSLAQFAEKTPYNKSRSEQILVMNMLIDNIRINLVSSTGNKEKAKRLLVDLEKLMKVFNKNVTPAERREIQKSNPTLAYILKSPGNIRKMILAVVDQVNYQGPGSSLVNRIKSFAKDLLSSRSVESAKKKLKAKITKLQNEYRAVKMQYEKAKQKIAYLTKQGKSIPGKLKQNYLRLKQKITSYKDQIIVAAKELIQYDKLSQGFSNVSGLLSSFKQIGDLNIILPFLSTIIGKQLPPSIRGIVDTGAFIEAMKNKDSKNILVRMNGFCDKFIKKSYLRTLFKTNPTAAFAFRMLTLSRIKALRNKPTKQQLMGIVLQAIQISIKHTPYYKLFYAQAGEKVTSKQKAQRILRLIKLKGSIKTNIKQFV